jgi:hypothetical protein
LKEDRMERIVVRIELPQSASSVELAWITSKDGKIALRVPANVPLRGRMAGRTKAYFWFREKGDELEIGDEAVGQDW